MARQTTGGLELDKEGQRIVTDYANLKGMKKNALVVRVLKWFSIQPPLVKSAIIGHVDDGAEAFYAEMLESLAADLRERMSLRLPQTGNTIRDGLAAAHDLPPKTPPNRRKPPDAG